MSVLKIKKAFISVWDKEKAAGLALFLEKKGVEIYSSSGTFNFLKKSGICVKDIAEQTGFPELLGGRVKTLHPAVFAGILADKNNPSHLQDLKSRGFEPFDLIVVDVYPFEKKEKEGLPEKELIEYIDIGGPSMLRAAAKNFSSVTVVCSSRQYSVLEKEIASLGGISFEIRRKLAADVFKFTSNYDRAVYNFLAGKKNLPLDLAEILRLRYGENPHQPAALYAGEYFKNIKFKQYQGKELSFNNFLDMDSALKIIRQFSQPAAVVIKHNSPCGAALGKDIRQAYIRAYKADPISSFGGIVGLNRKVSRQTAGEILNSGFREVVIAPDFSPQALAVFRAKKNLRVVKVDFQKSAQSWDIKSTEFGLLLQSLDSKKISVRGLKCVTRKKPTSKQLEDLLFAFRVAKYTKSNAVVIAKNKATLGIGMGIVSRIDSFKFAAMKSLKATQGAVAASDGFFPKEDNIEFAHKLGIKAIIQPGGSIKDKDVIKACDRYNIAMVFSGVRHFRH